MNEAYPHLSNTGLSLLFLLVHLGAATILAKLRYLKLAGIILFGGLFVFHGYKLYAWAPMKVPEGSMVKALAPVGDGIGAFFFSGFTGAMISAGLAAVLCLFLSKAWHWPWRHRPDYNTGVETFSAD